MAERDPLLPVRLGLLPSRAHAVVEATRRGRHQARQQGLLVGEIGAALAAQLQQRPLSGMLPECLRCIPVRCEDIAHPVLGTMHRQTTRGIDP